MTRDEIFDKVRTVLVDALAVDEDEVTPGATLIGDLGAESIDFLHIEFELQKTFGLRAIKGELFPEGVARNPEYVKDGVVTPAGIAELERRLPHVSFIEFKKDPKAANLARMFTVDAVVNFIERKAPAA